MLNLKVRSSRFSHFTKRESFKNYKKWFLFHLKSSHHSQDIQIFVFSLPGKLDKFFIEYNVWVKREVSFSFEQDHCFPL